MSEQNTFDLNASKTGTIECLGKKFASDSERRKYFTDLLRLKLKEPAFRKIDGFPSGRDEDILALSDPPFYTACPNPWLADLVKQYGTSYEPKKLYHREPFAADVSEGKNHPIYNAHSYHTKVPHRAIMRYILHYTKPGEVVFDGFCGTGMTGVAAQFCGNRTEVQELGYRVNDDGTILNEEGLAFSKVGTRCAVLNDLSPAATFIAYNYVTPIDSDAFEKEAKRLLKEVEAELGWMYRTKHTDGSVHRIDFTVWSEVFTCPECGNELTFIEEATDEETGGIREEFPCPQCKATLTKRKVERVMDATIDPVLKTPWKRVKFRPCLIQYRVGKEKHEKAPDDADWDILARIDSLVWPAIIPSNRWPIEEMYHGSRIEPKGFSHTHQFYLPRAAHALASLWTKASQHENGRMRQMLLFFVEQSIWGLSRMNRYSPTHFSQVNRMLSGVYYIASQHSECSPWYILGGKLDRLSETFRLGSFDRDGSQVTTGSADATGLPDNCVDYIFTDPPFGENIPYADLNLLIESWHGVWTQTKTEAIIDSPKGKELAEYQGLMLRCFAEYFRILKPGRWMTVEFSNSQASVWNAIQTTLQQAGFVVANVAALDKQQRSFRSVTTTTAVKQDLVISAYKPNGGLEERFKKSAGSVTGVWDFVQTHLKNLPVVKAYGGQLQFIAERDPRILHDRMVAFYIGHDVPVPLSSGEFQAALQERFLVRDGMIYLPEQTAEYDKKRAQMENVGQLTIFVEDEKSAINWLRNFLKERPSTYQDIQPEFMKQLSASWKKFESRPSLHLLLEQNFLQYFSTEPIPSQIHSYLSSNFKELRGLEKDDSNLKARAKDRWYVPDPRKAADVELLRDKRLLEEFWSYLPEGYTPAKVGDPQSSLPGIVARPTQKAGKKKYKEVRSEAIRVGFKYCYQIKDYQTILVVGQQLPEDIIQEDEQLQMIHDMAAMRSEA